MRHQEVMGQRRRDWGVPATGGSTTPHLGVMYPGAARLGVTYPCAAVSPSETQESLCRFVDSSGSPLRSAALAVTHPPVLRGPVDFEPRLTLRPQAARALPCWPGVGLVPSSWRGRGRTSATRSRARRPAFRRPSKEVLKSGKRRPLCVRGVPRIAFPPARAREARPGPIRGGPGNRRRGASGPRGNRTLVRTGGAKAPV